MISPSEKIQRFFRRDLIVIGDLPRRKNTKKESYYNGCGKIRRFFRKDLIVMGDLPR